MGPYYSDIILKILLDAGTSPIYIGFLYFITQYIYNFVMKERDYLSHSGVYNIWNKCNKVKIRKTWGQSAVVLINNKRSLHINATQRLNAKDLMDIYIMGLIEGDGWISVSKKGKYLSYTIGIELNIQDIQLLYKIKKHLGLGTIIIKNRINKETNKEYQLALYRIKDKKSLKNIIIPIFDKYNFYTNKHYDYVFFKECLLNNIIYYKDLPNYYNTNQGDNQSVTPIKYNRPKDKPYLSVNEILNNIYFKYWLIGFIEAEGHFSIYTNNKPPATQGDNHHSLKEQDNKDIMCFEISQTNEYNIIKAISIFFKITSNVYEDKNSNFRIKTTRSICIQNIINYMNNSPIKLQGKKKVQYIKFLSSLRNNNKFNTKLNIPNIY